MDERKAYRFDADKTIEELMVHTMALRAMSVAHAALIKVLLKRLSVEEAVQRELAAIYDRVLDQCLAQELSENAWMSDYQKDLLRSLLSDLPGIDVE